MEQSTSEGTVQMLWAVPDTKPIQRSALLGSSDSGYR